jgi:SAM-dependent methyltransferase
VDRGDRPLAGLPAAVLFTGICRVHRSQVLGLTGAWAQVADVGCGTGHAIVLLAGAFPASSVVGYDLAADAIARVRSEAAGLANARFEVRDAARLEVIEPFDVVFVFDAIHDQVAPAAVLERIWAALVPGGTFVMAEPGVSSNLAGNLATRWRRCCLAVHEAPGDPLNAVFVASRPGAWPRSGRGRRPGRPGLDLDADLALEPAEDGRDAA